MHNNTKRAGNTSQPDTLTIARWGDEMGHENGGIDGGVPLLLRRLLISRSRASSQESEAGVGNVFGAGETTTACGGL